VEALHALVNEGASLVPNPSSIHSHGRRSKKILNQSRDLISASIGAPDSEQLIFTSSGTEASQLAITSVLDKKLEEGKSVHWITTPVEHSCVLEMVKHYRLRGVEISFLPLDSNGAPQVSAIADLWQPNTALVSAVWVNNETGVITDVKRLAHEVRLRGGILHLDGAQAWGKQEVKVAELGVHYVGFAAHKIGALAGTGVLYVGPGMSIRPQQKGKQEKGRRAGTENVLGILAAGVAARELDPHAYEAKLRPLRDQLQSWILARIPGTIVNGQGANRVANTLNLSFEGVEGDGLVMALDLEGYSVSSGSACSSGVMEPSHVLLAMGRTKLQAMAAIRVSLTVTSSWDELEGFALALEKIVTRMRGAKRT
jgi:cysteine desulfurase